MISRSTTASETARSVRDGSASAEEVTRDALDRIAAGDGEIHAFLEVFEDAALVAARALDADRAAGKPLGPLAGVPVAVKDNICFEHGHTTCASRMLEGYSSPYTATALRRLIDAGAVVVGKTNLDEFAMGSSCEHSAFGPTANPWETGRVPGGSSGGSAAAVAAGFTPLALGSDTGGSIRQPASLCGVVGLKPTYGRVSRYGLVAFASSLDQIGPIARTVEDCALCLDAMAGHDALDATSAVGHDDAIGAPEPPRGGVLGVPRQALAESLDDEVRATFTSVCARLEGQGFELRQIDLSHSAHAVAAYYIVATAEASSNLARYDGVRYGRRAEPGAEEGLEALYTRSRAEGFGREVQRRIMLGTHVLSSGYYDAYYLRAQRARRLIKGDYDAAFDSGCDAILMPSTTGPAFRLGEKLDDPIAMYLEDVFTVGVNLAGLPAVSLPGGFGESSGLPVGVQLVGRAWEERSLLGIAARAEQMLDLGAPVAPA